MIYNGIMYVFYIVIIVEIEFQRNLFFRIQFSKRRNNNIYVRITIWRHMSIHIDLLKMFLLFPSFQFFFLTLDT